MKIFRLFVFFFILFFAACNDDGEMIPSQPINYLALGDSYTIGQGVEVSERWPVQLTERLRSEDYLIGKTEIIAQTGWKTADLLNAMSTADTSGYNLVSLLIGVNNQFSGQPFSVFKSEFDVLLWRSVSIAGGSENVFVLSIPDYGVTPFGANNRETIAREIDAYNFYIAQRCTEENIIFVDVTEISRELGSGAGALAPDNLHPSGSQYTDWMEAALPEVMELLKR